MHGGADHPEPSTPGSKPKQSAPRITWTGNLRLQRGLETIGVEVPCCAQVTGSGDGLLSLDEVALERWLRGRRGCVARLGRCRMLGVRVIGLGSCSAGQGENGVGITACAGVACMLGGGAGGASVDSCGVWRFGEALDVLAVAALAGACAV